MNMHDVMAAARCKPVVWVSFAPDYTMQLGGFGRKEGWNTWSEVVAATGISEWATCTNRSIVGQAWFPATFADAVAALTIGEDHSPVKVATGVPCAALLRGDQWHTSRCGRPATGTGAAQFRGNDAPLCNLHLAVNAKVAANDAARRAAWDERHRKAETERAMSQASADWAARLRDQYQVPADGMRCRHGELQVAVQPEQLYALLSAAAGALRDVGVEWAEVLAEVPAQGVREVSN